MVLRRFAARCALGDSEYLRGDMRLFASRSYYALYARYCFIRQSRVYAMRCDSEARRPPAVALYHVSDSKYFDAEDGARYMRRVTR